MCYYKKMFPWTGYIALAYMTPPSQREHVLMPVMLMIVTPSRGFTGGLYKMAPSVGHLLSGRYVMKVA